MNIKNSPSGRTIKALSGYTSFIPHPLPPSIEWNTALVNCLSRADHSIGMLAREGARLPNPHLLIRTFITREAVLSSRIEGTQATLSEVFIQKANPTENSSSNDIQEIHNYIEALDYGLIRLKDFPLSLRLIKEMHQKLLQGVRGAHATPGEFRRSQNSIGSPGCTLATAKYVPPLPEELMDCLSLFETFLYDRMFPPLVHIALCHYQFEAIHPFLDGNGRIGRLLIALLLVEHKLLPYPFLYISAFFEATRDSYYTQLYNVSSKGTWNEWLMYFLNGVTLQSLDALSRAERINGFITEWCTIVKAGPQTTLQEVLKNLAVNPYCTIKGVAEKFEIAFTTAQRIITKLELAGILTQTSDTKRDKIYCAQKILNILEEPTQISGETLH